MRDSTTEGEGKRTDRPHVGRHAAQRVRAAAYGREGRDRALGENDKGERGALIPSPPSFYAFSIVMKMLPLSGADSRIPMNDLKYSLLLSSGAL